ncbi:MAG: rhodanese-like domain-containing protein, partial [Bacteroidales bacterium]|nr:rhodanese-like domain-containing protein [Bacteroidales bacterium]
MNKTEKPTLQEFHIEGVKHIAPEVALELIEKNEAVLIDVREIHEVANESVELDNVLYHPMSVIMERLPYISKEQNIILICAHGVRSSKIANLFSLQGFPNVANLDGGFKVWKEKGLPYSSNLSYSAAGGCGCSCNTPASGNGGGG